MGPVTVENISLLVQAGQVPLVTTVELNPDGSNEFFEGFRPEDFSLLAYTYSSAQRPGVRVGRLSRVKILAAPTGGSRTPTTCSRVTVLMQATCQATSSFSMALR